MGLEEKKKN